jgi:hypothetical protein
MVFVCCLFLPKRKAACCHAPVLYVHEQMIPFLLGDHWPDRVSEVMDPAVLFNAFPIKAEEGPSVRVLHLSDFQKAALQPNYLGLFLCLAPLTATFNHPETSTLNSHVCHLTPVYLLSQSLLSRTDAHLIMPKTTRSGARAMAVLAKRHSGHELSPS